MRTIDKVGGLDEYLLGEKTGRIRELGVGGWALRWRVMQTEGAKQRFNAQRVALGLPPKEDLVGIDGLLTNKQELVDEMAAFDESMESDDVEVALEDGLEGEAMLSKEDSFMEEEPPRKTTL